MTVESINNGMVIPAEVKPAKENKKEKKVAVEKPIKVEKPKAEKPKKKDASIAETSEVNQEKIRKAVEQINKNLPNSEAVYGFHEGTNRVTIKIVDKDTKEVIKELPPEKTLDMIAKAWELAGLLIDERR